MNRSLATLTLLLTGCEWLLPYDAGPLPMPDAAPDAFSLRSDPQTPPDLPSPVGADIALPDLPMAPKDGRPDAWRLRITTDPVKTVGVLSTYQYQAQANATPVKWSLVVLPAGMTVDTAGLVSWKPTMGNHSVTLRVSDGTQTDDQSYVLQVVGGSMNGLHPIDLRRLIRSRALLGLAAHPLQGKHLVPEVRTWLADRSAARALGYVVGCALEAGDALHVPTREGPLVLRGELGLAPEWRREPCASRCQEWVSGCVAARVNTEGAPLPVLLATRAASPPGHTEGAFFGNLFANPPHLASCRARQAPPLLRGRRCTVDRVACWPVWPAGDCADVCDEGVGYLACRAPGSAGPRSPAITVILP